jgi:peptidoglycan/LPS O-acetylase OafA/YrhL
LTTLGATKSGPEKPATRIAGLDIMRAVAILFVLNTHCGGVFCAWLGLQPYITSSLSGFFGVELFFVLSGYLIGKLLIDILDRGATWRAWRVFMVRRWLRTLPLYYLCIVILSLIWRPGFWLPGYARLLHALPYFLTLTQSFAWPLKEDWFTASWSLAVEEWFYLLYSGLLFVCASRLRASLAFWIATAIFLLLPLYLRSLQPTHADFDQVISKEVIYRLDATGFGVVVAWLASRHPGMLRPKWLLLGAGLVLVVYDWRMALSATYMPFNRHTFNTVFFDMVSLGFAMMLPAALGCTGSYGLLGRIAGAISRQSYALYLFHLPVLEIIGAYREKLHLPAGGAILVSVSLFWGAAYLSAKWFEGPILRLRPAQGERTGLAAA